MSCSSRIIGPIIPETKIKFKAAEDNDVFDDSVTIGPTLPPGLIISNNSDNSGDEVIGPILPPNLYGPSLPTHSKKIIGPVLPSSELCESDDSEDSYIGPRLCEATDAATHKDGTASRDFERRAEKMKNKLLDKGPEVNKREEWMTELPNRLGPQIGMGPRTFKRRAPTGKEDDRSDWTDTPDDRARKATIEKTDEGPSVAEMTLHHRNAEISETLTKYNKTKRKESLMDIHKKNRKKKKKEESSGRREFDRDKDLNIQKVDSAEAKSAAQKARLLGGRFSHGASHFL